MSGAGEFGAPEIRTEAAILLQIARRAVRERPGVVDRRLAAIRHAGVFAANYENLCRAQARRARGGMMIDSWSRSADRWAAIGALVGSLDDGFAA